jgi:Lhr-like helicase
MCSECDGYEVVIVDGEEVHCATCSLRAEVAQLRDWHSEMFHYAADRDAEIERLRTEMERLRTALEVAANHMSMTGAPQTTIDAIRNAVRRG